MRRTGPKTKHKKDKRKNRHQGSPFFWEKKVLSDPGLSWGEHLSKPQGWGKRKTQEPHSEAGGRKQFAFSPRRGWADGSCYWVWLSPKKADSELTALMICFLHVPWGMLIRISKLPASHLLLIDNFSGLPGHLFDSKYITKITTEVFFNPFWHFMRQEQKFTVDSGTGSGDQGSAFFFLLIHRGWALKPASQRWAATLAKLACLLIEASSLEVWTSSISMMPIKNADSKPFTRLEESDSTFYKTLSPDDSHVP